MNSYVLLYFLPSDVISIVNKFVLINKSASKIVHNLKYYSCKQNILYQSINNLLNMYDLNYLKSESFAIDLHIENFNNVLLNYYSKVHYTKVFWNNYLNIFAHVLMKLYNEIFIFNNYSVSPFNIFVKFKKIKKLWFLLCKKYNVKLYLSYKNRNSNNILNYTNYARNIIKIFNFHNLNYAPKIVSSYFDDNFISQFGIIPIDYSLELIRLLYQRY